LIFRISFSDLRCTDDLVSICFSGNFMKADLIARQLLP
jgi:hypothetical protein